MQDRRKTNELLEGCPRGQREQTVNLPAYAFEGSNPSPSTLFRSLATTLRRRKAYGIRPRFAGANRCREEGHASHMLVIMKHVGRKSVTVSCSDQGLWPIRS